MSSSSKKRKNRERKISRKSTSSAAIDLISIASSDSDISAIVDFGALQDDIKIRHHIIILNEEKKNKHGIKYPDINIKYVNRPALGIEQLINESKLKTAILNLFNSDDLPKENIGLLPQLHQSLKDGSSLSIARQTKQRFAYLPILGATTSLINQTALPYFADANFKKSAFFRLYNKADKRDVIKVDSAYKSTFEKDITFRIKEKIRYYFYEPFMLLKNRLPFPPNNNPVYRLLFASLIILSFLVISVLSQSAGISGDEHRYISQAEKVYTYFATGGTDKAAITKTSIDPQHYNGQSFDNLLYVLQKWFNFDDIFKFRHLVNSWVGWLTMLFTALIALSFKGHRAAIMAFIFCFFSPRFLGHSYNNHRDIPVALAVIMTIYFALLFFRSWPKISNKALIGIIVSIAFAYSLRFGAGILMTGILGVSAFIYWFTISSKFRIFNTAHIASGFKLASMTIGASILAYFLGIINWPFGLEGPINNGKEVLMATSNLGVTIRQLFEGETIFSNKIPWYYTLKYIVITVPAMILIGSWISLIGFKKFKDAKRFDLFVILFCLIFPIAYTSITTKNDYGGWRHFLFTYPFIAITASLGYEFLLGLIKNKSIKKWGLACICLLLIHPIWFTISSHPYEYVYYNELVGGIKGAYGNYETDYSLNSLRGASDWLIKHADEIVPPGEKLRIGTNDYPNMKHYLRHHKDKFEVVYTRYYQKSQKDWDYAAYSATYIDGDQIKSGLWPPAQTVAEIKAGGVPIGAVIKRVSKEDYLAFQAMNNNDASGAMTHLNNYIKVNPNNEEVWVAKSRVEMAIGNLPAALKSTDEALRVYPEFISAFDSRGRIMFEMKNYKAAIDNFDRALKIRESYHGAHYFKALSYLRLGNYDAAIASSRLCISYKRDFKACYDTAADAYTQKGESNNAQVFITAKNNIK